MEELTIKEKAKRYDEALTKARNIVNSINVGLIGKDSFEAVFPELKESEDERIREALIELVRMVDKNPIHQIFGYGDVKYSDMIAWLEKQGEQKSYVSETMNEKGDFDSGFTRMMENKQKPTDKIKPKFKIGDWVFIEEIKGYKNGPFQINIVDSFGYSFDEYHTIPFMYEDLLSKWTIQDAKDGDVLATEPIEGYHSPFVAIYKKQNEEDLDSYCFIGFDGKFYKGENGHSTEEIHPATKEQRDLLFQKMKKARYEWDAENKQLRKIKQKAAEWSEEDERHLNSIIKRTLAYGDSSTYGLIKDDIDWLKFLKDRILDGIVLTTHE